MLEMKKHQNQLNNQENNPCFQEQQLSMQCLSDNGYDNEKCSLHFENYNTCRKFWTEVKKQRRIAGTRPYLPESAEREQIKKDFLERGRL